MTALTGGQAKPSARAGLGLGLGGIQVAALSAAWYLYGYFTFGDCLNSPASLVKALL
jgi:hypothetical protein